jgi:hypothetical protein
MRYQYVIFVCRCDYMGSKFVVYDNNQCKATVLKLNEYHMNADYENQVG